MKNRGILLLMSLVALQPCLMYSEEVKTQVYSFDTTVIENLINSQNSWWWSGPEPALLARTFCDEYRLARKQILEYLTPDKIKPLKLALQNHLDTQTSELKEIVPTVGFFAFLIGLSCFAISCCCTGAFGYSMLGDYGVFARESSAVNRGSLLGANALFGTYNRTQVINLAACGGCSKLIILGIILAITLPTGYKLLFPSLSPEQVITLEYYQKDVLFIRSIIKDLDDLEKRARSWW